MVESSTITVRMGANLKREFNAICTALGFSMSTAVNMLARKMIREQRMPFDVAITDTNKE